MADGGEEGNVSAPRGSARRGRPVRASLDADEFIALMHGSDPVRVELTRLENELRGESDDFLSFRAEFCGFIGHGRLDFHCCYLLDKERELGEAQAEIRALRLSERAREKAVEEVIAICPLYWITLWCGF